MADLLKVSILGSLPSGEKWSVSPVFKMDGVPGGSIPIAQLDAAATAVNALTVPTGVRNLFSGQTFVTGVRIEARNTGGMLVNLSEKARGAAVGGSGAVAHPFQTSVVLSLRTNAPGPRGRGRLYWPATGAAIDLSTLRITAANLTSFLAGAKTYLSDIKTAVDTAVDGTATLAVWSRVAPAADALQPIVRIQMGDVLDTQRRRRDTLVEGVQDLSFP